MIATKAAIEEVHFNTLHTDFRAEEVAANFLKYYDKNADVQMYRIGVNDRPFLKDIKNLYKKYFGFDGESIIVETYREGFYDYLPEGLFHPPSLGPYSHNVDSVVKEIRRQKEVEENARKFFRPFEMESFYTEVYALLKEKELDIADDSGTVIKVFSELWPLLKELDDYHAKVFLHILPFLHEVRGKKEWLERFLSAFLDLEVQISYEPNIITKDSGAEDTSTLGSTRR